MDDEIYESGESEPEPEPGVSEILYYPSSKPSSLVNSGGTLYLPNCWQYVGDGVPVFEPMIAWLYIAIAPEDFTETYSVNFVPGEYGDDFSYSRQMDYDYQDSSYYYACYKLEGWWDDTVLTVTTNGGSSYSVTLKYSE